MSNQCARAGGIIPIEAGVALTQGQMVTISSGKVIVCTAATYPFGSVTEDVAVGETASVAIPGAVGGTVYLEAHDNAITIGQSLIPAAAGRVDANTTAGKICGIALEASTAQGHLIECALIQQIPVA